MEAVDARPIYQAIADDLRNRIVSGQLAIGDQIPSESELCQTYEVSRMTVRQAVGSLQASGYLMTRRGKGTYVVSAKAERSASRLLGFGEDTVSRGLQPGTKVLNSNWTTLDREAQQLLGRPQPESAYSVERLRTVNGEPVGINQVILLEKWARRLEGADFAGSLYRIISTGLEDEVMYADQRIEAVAAGEEAARLLHLDAGAPLLRITRTTHTAQHGVIGLTRTHYRGDRYYLSLTVSRGEQAALE